MSAFLFKSLSVLFFVLMGTCIKLLADRVPLFEVVFFRNFFALFPVIFMLWKNNLKIADINQYPLHLMRAVFGICAMTLFFLSLRHVNLVEMQTISFSSVFFISILSVFFLREVIGMRRIIAIMFGFIGVVIILNPSVSVFSNYSLLPLIASLLLSFAVIFLKKILITNNNFLSIFIFTLFCSIISLAFMNSTWIIPETTDIILLILTGVLGFIAQVFLTKSYQLADASLLAPFEFSSLLWSYFIGYFLFHEVISLRVYLGGLIVVLSVAYIFYRESTLKKRIAVGINKQF
ncbi:DMT family transporter [Alphaproteobacteria bacterium]|nr:DMT family transporter [Alphaproteobacteria bacterium]